MHLRTIELINDKKHFILCTIFAHPQPVMLILGCRIFSYHYQSYFYSRITYHFTLFYHLYLSTCYITVISLPFLLFIHWSLAPDWLKILIIFLFIPSVNNDKIDKGHFCDHLEQCFKRHRKEKLKSKKYLEKSSRNGKWKTENCSGK